MSGSKLKRKECIKIIATDSFHRTTLIATQVDMEQNYLWQKLILYAFPNTKEPISKFWLCSEKTAEQNIAIRDIRLAVLKHNTRTLDRRLACSRIIC